MLRWSPKLAALGFVLVVLFMGSVLVARATHGRGHGRIGSAARLVAASALASDSDTDDNDDLTPDDAPAHEAVRVESVQPSFSARPDTTSDATLPASVIHPGLPTRGPPR